MGMSSTYPAERFEMTGTLVVGVGVGAGVGAMGVGADVEPPRVSAQPPISTPRRPISAGAHRVGRGRIAGLTCKHSATATGFPYELFT